MKKNNSSISLGLILILIGIGLILHRMNLIHFAFNQLYPIVALAVGAFSTMAVILSSEPEAFFKLIIIFFFLSAAIISFKFNGIPGG